MINRETTERGVRHIALVGLQGALMASMGALMDGVSLVGRQVKQAYGQPMNTRLRLLTVDGAPVQLAGGRMLGADGRIDEREVFRVVHVPAFAPDPTESIEQRLAREGALCAWLRRQRAAQALISATGISVFILAEAGLLNDGVASVPRHLADAFRRRYPRIRVQARTALAEYDGIFTAASLGSEWELVARLVELAFSPQTAGWLAAVTGLRRGVEEPILQSDDPLVAGAQFWLRERFTGTFRITDLARDLAVSHPTLIRRFHRSLGMAPRDYAQMLRIDAAKRMLVTTDRSVNDVALMVGYADARALRAVFREHTGKSPTHFRNDGG